ncbi:SDR family oxidoreductase [soil metagenome]
MSNWDLKNRIALVTGGSRGIGAAISNELISLGAEVIIVSRDPEITSVKSSDNLHKLAFNIGSRPEREKLVKKVKNLCNGKLDILINNAGTNIRKKSIDYTDEEYKTITETNLAAPFDLCKLLYPELKASGTASIVNISSVSGLTSTSSGVIYAMTKAALHQMTKYLAVEWAPDNIRVNAIAPWYINTELVKPVLSNLEAYDRILARTPNNRIGDPEDISGAAAFFCMDKAKHITGQILAIDGGFTSYGY